VLFNICEMSRSLIKLNPPPFIELLAAPTDTSTPVERLMQVDYKYSGMSYRSSAPSYVDRVLISSNESEQFL